MSLFLETNPTYIKKKKGSRSASCIVFWRV